LYRPKAVALVGSGHLESRYNSVPGTVQACTVRPEGVVVDFPYHYLPTVQTRTGRKRHPSLFHGKYRIAWVSSWGIFESVTTVDNSKIKVTLRTAKWPYEPAKVTLRTAKS